LEVTARNCGHVAIPILRRLQHLVNLARQVHPQITLNLAPWTRGETVVPTTG